MQHKAVDTQSSLWDDLQEVEAYEEHARRTLNKMAREKRRENSARRYIRLTSIRLRRKERS